MADLAHKRGISPAEYLEGEKMSKAVSYTHLTLPTSDLV